MFKIVLVDDEMIEIEALKFMLSRNFDNLLIVGEATNGIEAIEVVKLTNPDIVVMDIRMPGIDGLKAIEEIKKISPNIRVLMLTAYSSFEYALHALKLGVDDYLLKPIKRSNMIETLNKIIEKINNEGKQFEQNQILKNAAESMVPYIKNEIFQSIVTGEGTSDIIAKNSSFIGMDIERSFCIVLRILDNNEITNASKTNNYPERKIILDAANEIVKELCPCLVSDYINNDILIIVPVDKNSDESVNQSWAAGFVNYLNLKIQSKAKAKLVFGAGKTYKGYGNLHNSYMEALYAIKYGNEDETLRLYSEDKKMEGQLSKFLYPYELEKKLMDKVLSGYEDESLSLLESLFAKIIDIYNNNFFEIKEKVLEIVLVLNRYSYQYASEQNEIKFVVGDYHTEINEIKDANQLKLWLLNYAKETIDLIAKKRINEADPIVFNAIEYINCNYEKELTLENVAQKVGVSTYYFSRLFKLKTRKNFVDFVSELRVAKAKELLKDPKRSIKEIAYETGFNSQIYFCKVFKKTVNLTPMEFRELGQR